MTDYSTETWVLLTAIAAVGIGAILNLWATAARNALHIHELKAKVQVLRTRYAEDQDTDDQDAILEV